MMWVAVWLHMILKRRSSSITKLRLSPTLTEPICTVPMWRQYAPFFCTSVIVISSSLPSSVEVKNPVSYLHRGEKKNKSE